MSKYFLCLTFLLCLGCRDKGEVYEIRFSRSGGVYTTEIIGPDGEVIPQNPTLGIGTLENPRIDVWPGGRIE